MNEPEVTLISIQRTTGSGVTVEYGYMKEFAFDLPTALRRLASRIEDLIASSPETTIKPCPTSPSS